MTSPGTTAPLVEVFSAIQGEGLILGTRQVFIRFAGCDLRCHFCDSAHTWQPTPDCLVEFHPGARDFLTYPNPVSQANLQAWVRRLDTPQGLHDSISLTGGEPLLQQDFLEDFLPQVHQLPIYLETGGHLPTALAKVLPHIDLVGMDWKLPSVSGETLWSAHQEFLAITWSYPRTVFVKIIISAQTEPADLHQAMGLIAQVSPQIPVILQPVTPCRGVEAPTPAQVLDWQALCKQTLAQVRVIPQTHKLIGQR